MLKDQLYRMPDGSVTEDSEEYAAAWHELGEKACAYFPGYTVTAYDPDVVFERHETSTRTGCYRAVDRFSLSPMAIRSLLTKSEPPKTLRDDF